MKLKFSIFHKILLAMLLVAIVPLSIIWYVDYRATSTRISAAVEQRLLDVSDKLAGQVDDWVAMNLKVLKQNAALADMVSMDAKLQNPILQAVLGEYQWSYLVFTIAPNGMNVGRSDDKPPIDYSDRVYYKQVMDGSPMGQQVVISKTTGKPSLILSAPIHALEAGLKRVVGVIAMGMSIAEMSDRITNLRIGDTGFAFLLDDTGKVVAHQKQEFADKMVDFSKHPAFVKRPREGRVQLNYDDAGREVIAYVQATGPGWTLVSQQNVEEAYAPLRAANLRAAVILAVTLVLVVIVALLVAGALSRPIRSLTRVADEMSRGGLAMKIPEVNRSDEIGALAAAIDRMGVSIRLAMERLRKT